MSVLDFSDIFDIISEKKSLQWIEVSTGTVENRDYVRSTEASPVSFLGWFVKAKLSKFQMRETGATLHTKYVLRVDMVDQSQVVNMKPKDYILVGDRRFLIDSISEAESETAVRHYECSESDA